MDKYVLAEHLNTIKTAICETFKQTQRIKLTSFDVSNHYIILGTSSGGIYIFKRTPCEFLRIIPSKEGPAIQVKISLNEKNLALASYRGLVIILENFFVDLNLRPFLYTEHDGNTITVMKWHGNDLYCGDNIGKISVCTVHSILTKAIFQTPSSTLMHLDSSIVQIDTYKNYLLISTKTRTYLCDTEKEQYKQIGKKLRDGNFGACFSQTDFTDYSDKNHGARSAFKTIEAEENFSNVLNNNEIQIYCARPGARLWTANFAATVLATYQFRSSLSEKASNIINIDNSKEARLNIIKFDNTEIPKDFNFGKVYALYPNILLTYDSKGIYFFNIETSSLLCWSQVFDNIREIKILKPHIYLWRNDLQVNIISLQSIEELVITTLFNKQYLLCSEICIEFNDDILSLVEKSKKINLISILRNKLKDIGAEEELNKMSNILDSLDKYYKDQKLGVKLENGIVVVDNQYLASATQLPEILENSVQNSNVNSSPDENFKILYKQFVLNKTHKLAELTESSRILNNSNLNELPSLFNSFIEYVKEKFEDDASLWCKEQTLKLANKNYSKLQDLEPSTINYISNSFLELNDYKHDCCKCKFPLPKAHKRKIEQYNLACKLCDCTENERDYLYNIPFLYRRKASEILKLSLIMQYSDKEVFKECLDKLTYDTWDEIIKLFLKLNKGQCLNCTEKIDTGGIMTWTELGTLMIESVGPKNAVRLLSRYANYIPKGDLEMEFFQSCIFSTTSGNHGLAVKLVEDVKQAGNSQMFGNNLEQFLTKKYVNQQPAVKVNKSDLHVTKCSYCQLPLSNLVLTEIKRCDCGNSFHQICFNGGNNICKFCVNVSNI